MALSNAFFASAAFLSAAVLSIVAFVLSLVTFKLSIASCTPSNVVLCKMSITFLASACAKALFCAASAFVPNNPFTHEITLPNSSKPCFICFIISVNPLILASPPITDTTSRTTSTINVNVSTNTKKASFRSFVVLVVSEKSAPLNTFITSDNAINSFSIAGSNVSFSGAKYANIVPASSDPKKLLMPVAISLIAGANWSPSSRLNMANLS